MALHPNGVQRSGPHGAAPCCVARGQPPHTGARHFIYTVSQTTHAPNGTHAHERDTQIALHFCKMAVPGWRHLPESISLNMNIIVSLELQTRRYLKSL